MTLVPGTRPALTPDLPGAELLRWYWTASELAGLARTLGVPAGGAKLDVLARLAEKLDGRAPAPPPRRRAAAHPGPS
jgi:hypothetical protein